MANSVINHTFTATSKENEASTEPHKTAKGTAILPVAPINTEVVAAKNRAFTPLLQYF